MGAIKLPSALSASIEAKTQAEQEASRKAIEAGGIAEFQRIVSEGISEELLMWKGIEATEKLAESDNAKMIVMGNSKESLPVLLSGESPSSDAATTTRLRGAADKATSAGGTSGQ